MRQRNPTAGINYDRWLDEHDNTGSPGYNLQWGLYSWQYLGSGSDSGRHDYLTRVVRRWLGVATHDDYVERGDETSVDSKRGRWPRRDNGSKPVVVSVSSDWIAALIYLHEILGATETAENIQAQWTRISDDDKSKAIKFANAATRDERLRASLRTTLRGWLEDWLESSKNNR